MSWSTSLRVADMLARERPLIDRIIGSPAYEIEDTDPNEAMVRSQTFVMRIVFDRERVGDVMVYFSAGGASSEPIHPLETWARFLGMDWLTFPSNRSGKATISAQQQVHENLVAAVELVKEIFANPQRGREASAFADGYNAAYNDWASGKGYWKDRD